MTDGVDHEDGQASVRDINWCAARVDEAALTGSRYAMVIAIREAAGAQIYGDVPPDLPDEIRAMCWAFDYNIEIDAAAPHHIRVEPRFDFGNGHTEPPVLQNVAENIRALWNGLVDLVQHPAAKGQLHHLLFECGGRERNRHGIAAVDTYLASAEMWSRELDSVEALQNGERLAHAIGDTDRAKRCLERLLDTAEAELATDTPRAGIVLGSLEHVVRAPLCPARVDTLLERATEVLSGADLQDDALELMQARCTDNACRQALWERRVEVFIAAADSHDSPIFRLTLRQKALQIADQSGRPDLRERAAAQLQVARDDDLGLLHFEASCAVYDEHAERVRQSFIQGQNWQQALISYANAGPLSGDLQSNQEAVSYMREHNQLRFLMPQKILGPDQMPILEAPATASGVLPSPGSASAT
jgi:hypothetical protein